MAAFPIPKVNSVIPAGSLNTPRFSASPYDPARFSGMSDYLNDQMKGYLGGGEDFASQYFGPNNKDMAEIIAARKAAAFGQDPQTAIARAQGVNGINSEFATGMRSLKGLQGATGLSGGAAIGQALPQLAKANLARSQLEGNLATDAANRRDAALTNLESTITGERAGRLGTTLGYAGLGLGNQSNAMQYVLGQDYVTSAANAAANAAAGGGGAPGGPNNQDMFTRAYKGVTGNIGLESDRDPFWERHFAGLKKPGWL